MILRTCDIGEFIRRTQGREVVCFGAGWWLTCLSNEFPSSGIERSFSYIVDNNAALWGTTKEINGITLEVHPPRRLYESGNNPVVLITVGEWTDVYETLNKETRLENTECYPALYLKVCELDRLAYTTTKPPENWRMNETAQIPKTIHYIWVGGNPLPRHLRECVESWRRLCPDYQIIEWNEKTYDFYAHPYSRQTMEAKKWGFAGDYARLDIVYRYGGIYLDTDVQLVKNPDELLYNSAYCGFASVHEVCTGSGFGAAPKHPMIKAMRDDYDHLTFIQPDGTLNLTPSTAYQTDVLVSHGLKLDGTFQVVDGMAVYPIEYLTAASLMTNRVIITPNTYSVHRYEASWFDQERKMRENERRQRLKLIFENEKDIERIS